MAATRQDATARVIVFHLHEGAADDAIPGVLEAAESTRLGLVASPVSARFAPEVAEVQAGLRDVAALESCLAMDELLREGKLRTEALRHRFAASHAALRSILGACIGVEPKRVAIVQGPNGKPKLAGDTQLHFSLSHAKDAFAIAWGSVPLGIDIESQGAGERLQADIDSIATRYFSRPEQERLRATEPGRRIATFLQTWTRKEAVLKAAGGALDQLQNIDTVESGLIALEDEDGVAQAFCVHTLPAQSRIQLAFAARMPNAHS